MSNTRADQDVAQDTVTVTLDGQEISGRPGELLIAAAERHGTYIPRFCYHERMKPVGMCRMCIVEVDTGRGPALQPSCMLEVSEGMTVETESPVTKKAQEGVLEFLLINHPLDCPVCDKGGECPLQDQTMSYGPGESRFLEEKRHFEKPIPVSDLVLLDRERCILCDRCTRFATEVAGDPFIQFQGRGNENQINTFPGHPFASYFSGNTVQICPVGALTSTAYRFKARPWDLEEVESTCTACAVGCRVTVQSSRNKVTRYEGVDIDEVNWGWLCDKGRYGFEAVGNEERLSEPLLREEEGVILEPATWAQGLSRAANAVQAGLDRSGPEGVAVLGGARLTNEDAYTWVKFAKGVLGSDNVDCQLGDGLPPELIYGLPRTTIDGALTPGSVVVSVASDIKEELPVLYLRLRHAVLEDGVTLIELAPSETAVSHLASHSLRYRSGELPALAEALVNGETDQTEVAGVRVDVIEALAELLAASAPQGDAASADAEPLPLTIVAGRHNLAEPGTSVAAAVAALANGLPGAKLLSGLRRANVHGALDMGMAPGLLPGGTSHDERTEEGRAERARLAEHWPRMPEQRGMDAEGILQAAAAGKIDTLFLVGADPLGDFPDRSLAERALAGARTVIACDLFMNESVRQADVVLPSAGFAEVNGTTTNLEGRVSSLAKKVTPPGTAQADWSTAAELALRLGHDLGIGSPLEAWDEITRVAASYASVAAAPGVESRPAPGTRGGPRLPGDGVLVPLPGRRDGNGDGTVAGETTADVVDLDLPAREAEPGGEAEPAGEAQTGDDVAEAAGPEPTADEAADDDAADDDAAADDGAETTIRVRELLPLPVWPRDPVPATDAYSLRLVATRKLYDQGTLVRNAPVLVGLAEGAVCRLNPADFDKLGVYPGEDMRISSAAGHVIVPTRPSSGVARGTAVIHLNQGGGRVNSLLDVNGPVTDVRVERP